MATIEERAEAYSRGKAMDGTAYRGYVQGATEQDRIARQEERERCIKAACKEHCDWCQYNGVWRDKYYSNCQQCVETDELRKAIEGGEE